MFPAGCWMNVALGVDLMQPIVSTSSAAWVMASWKQELFCSDLLGSRVGCRGTASPLWLIGEKGGEKGGGGRSETCRRHHWLLSAGGQSLWAGCVNPVWLTGAQFQLLSPSPSQRYWNKTETQQRPKSGYQDEHLPQWPEDTHAETHTHTHSQPPPSPTTHSSKHCSSSSQRKQ